MNADDNHTRENIYSIYRTRYKGDMKKYNEGYG